MGIAFLVIGGLCLALAAWDLSITKDFNLGGKTFSHRQTISKEGLEGVESSVPVAWAGTLTTRTDANTGTITMTDAGHLITTGLKVDLYWTNADGTTGQRRNMTVGTVSGTSVPVDLGSGTDLPIATSAIIVARCQSFTVSIAGNTLAALLAGADPGVRCQIVLYSGGTTEELAISLLSNEAYGWDPSQGTNPIVGDSIDTIVLSHADVALAQNVRCLALLDI